MASQFVRKITDTTINEPIKETTTSGDLIITKDDKVLINLNGVLKDLTPSFSGDELNELKQSVNKNTDDIAKANAAIDKNANDIKKNSEDVVHNTGNETVAGTKTFTDGVTLSGKNVVNGFTDTDWLDIPLEKGRTGIAKYKVSFGKVFVHLMNIKGVTATGNDSQGKIGTLPVSPNTYLLRYTSQSLTSGTLVSKQITIETNGDIYVSNTMGNSMSENDLYILDIVLI